MRSLFLKIYFFQIKGKKVEPKKLYDEGKTEIKKNSITERKEGKIKKEINCVLCKLGNDSKQ